ncbi:MAG TPA: hypothetical protein PKL13_02090 [bacterium]|nr:hypothetical protein [bacterium]
MDKIKKLLMKISRFDREKLLQTVEKLISNDKSLNIVKIKNTDFYRVRCGKFRIIFHKEKNEIVVDSIKMRNEKTYKL